MSETGTERVLHNWTASVRLLTNVVLWKSLTFALGLSSLLAGVLMSFVAGSLQGIAVAGGIFAGLMALCLPITLVIDAFGGLRVRFVVTTEGVHSLSGGARVVGDVALVGALLTNSLTGLAASHGARAEQHVFIRWTDVTGATIDARRRYIEIAGGALAKPVGLYCTPDNFDAVLATCRHASSAFGA